MGSAPQNRSSAELRDELTRERDQVVIATKGGLRQTSSGLVRDSSPDWLRRGVDASLSALGIEHIDLYQVHWPDKTVPATETAGALADLIAAGKITHVGVSNYTAAQIREFSETLPVETLQPPYHLFRRDIEQDTLPYCREHNIGVLVYGPLAHDLLTGTLNAHTASPMATGAARAQSFAAGPTAATSLPCSRCGSSAPTATSRSANWRSRGRSRTPPLMSPSSVPTACPYRGQPACG
jgi:aryl-alcohol dehydrogenase-like predicted oxidoreductase